MKYLLLGVKTWVALGGLIALVSFLMEGSAGAAGRVGLLYGGVMALGFVFWQWRGDRRLQLLGVEPRPGLRQSETVDLTLTPAEAGSEAKQLLGLMPKFWVVSASVDGTEVQGRRGSSWNTWGEKIHITCERAPGGSRVHISSQPFWRLQFMDFGQNQMVVTTLRILLEQAQEETLEQAMEADTPE